MDTRVAYTALVGGIAVQRLIELRVSSQNTRRAMARGAVEAGAAHYRWMVALHATFLGACVAETWVWSRPWIPVLGWTMLTVLAAAMVVRYWVIATLAGRWTTRVVYIPGDPLVTRGPFRWLRHPNYLVVATEIAALPLVHAAWITAVVYTVANGFLLRRRIAVEENLLARFASHAEGED
jgi:methyltransferase